MKLTYRFNYTKLSQEIGDSSKYYYVSIIRDPVDIFVSSWYYYKLPNRYKNMTLGDTKNWSIWTSVLSRRVCQSTSWIYKEEGKRWVDWDKSDINWFQSWTRRYLQWHGCENKDWRGWECFPSGYVCWTFWGKNESNCKDHQIHHHRNHWYWWKICFVGHLKISDIWS